MPLNKHFAGHGAEVMAAMKRTYGDTAKAKSIFYAKDNKNKAAAKKGPRKSAGK
jgi:hypothetical protein